MSDGVHPSPETDVLRRLVEDVASVIPPFTLYHAIRRGPRRLATNLAVASSLAASAWALTALLGDPLQWIALAIGWYAAFSSAQALAHRDPATFALTWGTPAFRFATLGFGFASMLTLNMGFWTAPLALRSLPVDKGTVGLILGATAAVCGIAGVFAGGRVSDIMLRRHPAGRIFVGMASCSIPVPFVIAMCRTHDPWIFFLSNGPVVFFGIMWMAAGAATIQEIVLPRMRGTASVTYFLVSTLLGSALGPYLVGKVSAARGSLSTGIAVSLLAVPIALATLWMAGRCIEAASTTKFARAKAAGDPGDDDRGLHDETRPASTLPGTTRSKG